MEIPPAVNLQQSLIPMPTSALNLLLASTSTVHGAPYLSYLKDAVLEHFSGCNTVAFVPFARPGGITWNDYTSRPQAVFAEWGLTLRGIHTWESPEAACAEADGFFTGGGNTFLLLKTLQEQGWMDVLDRAVQQGKPYMGSSAGTNIAGLSIGTTNDMPIAHPKSLSAFGWVPFNLNPHYVAPDPSSTHMGETRDQRIAEFHSFHPQPVLGLREGSWLRAVGGQIHLNGTLPARLFSPGSEPSEIAPGRLLLGE